MFVKFEGSGGGVDSKVKAIVHQSSRSGWHVTWVLHAQLIRLVPHAMLGCRKRVAVHLRYPRLYACLGAVDVPREMPCLHAYRA